MTTNDLVLAFDPGKSDMAWAILRGDGELIDTGMISTPINEFNHLLLTRKIIAFTKEIEDLFSRHQYFAVAAERYQIRGMGTVGEICEFVNLMLGIVVATARRQEHVPHIDLQPASQWKNWLSVVMHGKSGLIEKTPDVFGYFQVTKQASKRKVRDVLPIQEHQFDAIGIAAWFVAHEVRTDLPDQTLLLERIKPGIDRIWAEGPRRG